MTTRSRLKTNLSGYRIILIPHDNWRKDIEDYLIGWLNPDAVVIPNPEGGIPLDPIWDRVLVYPLSSKHEYTGINRDWIAYCEQEGITLWWRQDIDVMLVDNLALGYAPGAHRVEQLADYTPPPSYSAPKNPIPDHYGDY